MSEADPVEVLRAAKRLFTTADVAAALDRMAAAITARLRGERLVLLAMMHGGVFAATELAKRLRFPFEFDYVHATRYGQALAGGALEWRVPPTPALHGRAVLIIDDVLDRGITLAALIARLEQLDVASLHTAVLIRKHLREPLERPAVDFVGLETDDHYLFGCGMDYRGFWRGLPEIYGVEP
jgi:hypoxanthine phosphoribosyltransferase